MLKVKIAEEYECVCIGIDEGAGRLAGRVGALVCKLRHDDGFVRFNCGSGLTSELRIGLDDARVEADDDEGGYVGRVVTVQCNGLTDSGRPRFPRFVRWRWDRSATDVLQCDEADVLSDPDD